jgi:hypothetical protein
LAAATEQAELILTQARSEAERMRREGRSPDSIIEPPPPDVARSFMLETETKAMPRARAPRALAESWPASNAKAPRRALPDDADLNPELDVSLFDLFDELG